MGSPEGDLQGQIVKRRHVFDGFIFTVASRKRAIVPVSEHGVRCRKGCAVRPQNALFQLPGDRGPILRNPTVFRRWNGRRQARNQLTVLVIVGQRLQHQRGGLGVFVPPGQVGIGDGGGLPEQEGQGLMDPITVSARTHQQPDNHHNYAEQPQHAFHLEVLPPQKCWAPQKLRRCKTSVHTCSNRPVQCPQIVIPAYAGIQCPRSSPGQVYLLPKTPGLRLSPE